MLSLRNEDKPPPFKKAFMQINTYALLVMICLILSALGTGWN